MASKPVLLLLGYGANIGHAAAKKFEAGGYRVAIAARSLSEEKVSDQRWSYPINLTHPNAVTDLFAKATRDIGIPSVVIYNAAAATFVAEDRPFAPSLEEFENDLTINTSSLYAAAKAAVEGFEKLPASTLTSFLYTGNGLNAFVRPSLLTLGVGKSASSHIIEIGAKVYGEKGHHFYYVDERKADGSTAGRDISGPAHADHFFELHTKAEQAPWLQTFVAGKGYVKFD